MPEYSAKFYPDTMKLDVRRLDHNATPFEGENVMESFEAAGQWDAVLKARDHFITKMRKVKNEPK